MNPHAACALSPCQPCLSCPHIRPAAPGSACAAVGAPSQPAGASHPRVPTRRRRPQHKVGHGGVHAVWQAMQAPTAPTAACCDGGMAGGGGVRCRLPLSASAGPFPTSPQDDGYFVAAGTAAGSQARSGPDCAAAASGPVTRRAQPDCRRQGRLQQAARHVRCRRGMDGSGGG